MSNYLQPLKTIILALLLAVGISLAHAAWVGPTAAPPGENTPAPVNVGIADQVKEGGLGVDALSVFGSSYIQGNLGIGVTDPTAALDIAGGLRIRSGTPGAGKVLTSDDSGVATWRTPAGGTLQCITRSKRGNPVTVKCPAGYTLTGGGASFSNWNVDRPIGSNRWRCAQHPKFGTGICFARCCKL